jgi:hypothetical protein
MQLFDRIERRRFVGRELLLWLWFQSETNESTLTVPGHGEVGLWIARHLVLSEGKESTRIKGALPGTTREAKEALLGGKLPESAGIQLSWKGQDISFSFKAEKLALSALNLPTVLGDEKEEAALLPPLPPRRRKKAAREEPSDEAHEAFYERMRLTREVEELIEALYREFLAIRLEKGWSTRTVPRIRKWIEARP